MSKTHRVIVGEWSLGLSGNKHFDALSSIGNDLAMRAYAAAQLLTQEECFGWYFWSYKLQNTTMEGWDYRKSSKKGWLPSFADM